MFSQIIMNLTLHILAILGGIRCVMCGTFEQNLYGSYAGIAYFVITPDDFYSLDKREYR